METNATENTTVITKNWICTKEKYLELKALQKRATDIGKIARKNRVVYILARRTFYKSKGMQVPGSFFGYEREEGSYSIDERNGFKWENVKTEKLDAYEARYLNIIYGVVKGRTYNQIEQKTREGHGVDSYYLEKYCKKYGIDRNLLEKVWVTE